MWRSTRTHRDGITTEHLARCGVAVQGTRLRGLVEGMCLLRGKARIDFRPLAGQLKLEFQYAVQCRHGQQTITAPPPVVTWALRLAANSGVVSLLDYQAQHWRERCTHKSGGWYEGFLLHAHEVVEMLRDGTGWDVEYPRDVWRLHTLPGLTRNAGHTTDARNHLRFDRLSQPWLRALAKRWCRLRLSSGLTVGTVVSDVTALTRCSMFLEHHAADVRTLADLDRSLLERYLAWVSTQTFGDGAKDDCITTLGAFFQAIPSTTGTTRCPRPRCSFLATSRADHPDCPASSLSS